MTSQFIPAAYGDLSHLPSWTPYNRRISALPMLRGWFNGLGQTVVRDVDNRIIQWNNRAGPPSRYVRPGLYQSAGSPLFVRNAYRDRNAIRFTKANQDVLQWSGQRAIGRVPHTTILVVDLKPQTIGVQYLLGDSTPTPGQHILTVDRRADGTVMLGFSTGVNGSVGIIKEITPFVNVGRPMLIIASADGFFNAVKLQVNSIRSPDFNGDPTLQASDVYIGASGFADSARGLDADLYDLIMLQADIFADGFQGHFDGLLSYAYVAYDIL
jgi:hypothetical protein